MAQNIFDSTADIWYDRQEETRNCMRRGFAAAGVAYGGGAWVAGNAVASCISTAFSRATEVALRGLRVTVHRQNRSSAVQLASAPRARRLNRSRAATCQIDSNAPPRRRDFEVSETRGQIRRVTA